MYGNNDYRDYLAHYGVLGMKWGVRKRKTSSSSKAVSKNGNKAVRNLGTTNKLTVQETTKHVMGDPNTKDLIVKEYNEFVQSQDGIKAQQSGIDAVDRYFSKNPKKLAEIKAVPIDDRRNAVYDYTSIIANTASPMQITRNISEKERDRRSMYNEVLNSTIDYAINKKLK